MYHHNKRFYSFYFRSGWKKYLKRLHRYVWFWSWSLVVNYLIGADQFHTFKKKIALLVSLVSSLFYCSLDVKKILSMVGGIQWFVNLDTPSRHGSNFHLLKSETFRELRVLAWSHRSPWQNQNYWSVNVSNQGVNITLPGNVTLPTGDHNVCNITFLYWGRVQGRLGWYKCQVQESSEMVYCTQISNS